MQDYELQNLAEQVGQLTKGTIGLNLTFRLRVELGPTVQISEATLAKVNDLLAEVSEKLNLRSDLGEEAMLSQRPPTDDPASRSEG